MARDLNALWAWIEEWEAKMSRLFSGAFLENSSITNGRLRFIGGLLRLDSGARLEGDGVFQWKGVGSIEGNFEVLGNGSIKVGGVIITPLGGGRIQVGDGVIIDASDGGKITAGQIRIQNGRIYVGDNVEIDGATGAITIRAGGRVVVTGPDGDTILSESKMTFANGSTVDANGGSGAAIRAGTYVVVAQSGIASLGSTGRRFEVDGFYEGPRIVGMPTMPLSLAPEGAFAGCVVASSNGVLYRVTDL